MSDKRNTWQKQVIYSVIKELKTHPTIQNLIDELEKRGYKIGKSTVYRVMADAVDDGLVMNVYSGDKHEHYDGNTENHYHIRCKVCDRIYDSELPFQEGGQRLIRILSFCPIIWSSSEYVRSARTV